MIPARGRLNGDTGQNRPLIPSGTARGWFISAFHSFTAHAFLARHESRRAAAMFREPERKKEQERRRPASRLSSWS
jgi:hypothetical protein